MYGMVQYGAGKGLTCDGKEACMLYICCMDVYVCCVCVCMDVYVWVNVYVWICLYVSVSASMYLLFDAARETTDHSQAVPDIRERCTRDTPEMHERCTTDVWM